MDLLPAVTTDNNRDFVCDESLHTLSMVANFHPLLACVSDLWKWPFFTRNHVTNRAALHSGVRGKHAERAVLQTPAVLVTGTVGFHIHGQSSV